MASVKVSVTIREELLAEVRAQGGDNLSATVNEALEAQVHRDRLRRFLDEETAKHGPPSAEAKAWVDRVWKA